ASVLRYQERQATEHRNRIAQMRRVVGGEGLSLVYQPVARVTSGEVVMVEALARIDPGDASTERESRERFEEAGSVGFRVDLELACLRRALRECPEPPPGKRLSINV